MRSLAASAVLVVPLTIGCAACTATTPGVASPVRMTVTVVSTVTATPSPPGWRVFRSSEVERGVVTVLKDVYKISDVGVARCPEDQPVVPDTSFECTVRIGGETRQVKITIKTEDGEYEVGQPR
jgi:hypothetical protein